MTKLHRHVLAADLHQGLKAADDQGQRGLEVALARDRLDMTQRLSQAIRQRRAIQ